MLILDWLARDGGYVLRWWLLLSMAGVAVLPLTWNFLSHLADRGMFLSRILGLIAVVGLFWWLVSLRFLQNSAGSLAFCWLLVWCASLYFSRFDRRTAASDWKRWWQEHKIAFICGELLFVILLVGWSLFRARIQDLASTEKPMELMLLSAINQSPQFPPNDAWLSGHSVSYYYFGYLISAALAKLSGVTNAVAFDLSSASWLALSGITIFGTGYNLIRGHSDSSADPESAPKHRYRSISGALLTVFFALWLSNGHYLFIELPYQRGIAAPGYLQFMDAKDRCEGSGKGYWWWFAAARTIVDRTPGDEQECNPETHREVIDEFPAFSFLLGDNHPHVYGIPLIALMITFAWHRFSHPRPPQFRDICVYGMVLGAVLCTNAWDAPVFFVLLLAAEALRLRRMGAEDFSNTVDWRNSVKFAAQTLCWLLLFAAPLLLHIRSQAGGLAPNLDHPTRIQQLWVMFAPFIILYAVFFLAMGRKLWSITPEWRFGLSLTVSVAFLMSALTLTLHLFTTGASLQDGILAFLHRRMQWEYSLSQVFLFASFFILSTLSLRLRRSKPALSFTVLLAIAGISLILIPEFIYIRDLFGSRMNTVFKLYFQAWLLFAVAAAYASYHLLQHYPSQRIVIGGTLSLVIILGSLYLPAGMHSRMQETPNRTLTLGNANASYSASDWALSQCLSDMASAGEMVIAEGIPAPGGRRSYDLNYGRIATISGIPTVIAWEPHQNQWRGGSYPHTVGLRPRDIDALYRSDDWPLRQEIIDRYQIDYIIWGSHEQYAYGPPAEEIFAENLIPICLQEDSSGRSLAYATRFGMMERNP